MAARPLRLYRSENGTPSPVEDVRLADIPYGEAVELIRLDLPEHEAEPLLERGVMPGCRLCPIRRSPFGDPIVEVDGTVLALRRETAVCLCVRRGIAPTG